MNPQISRWFKRHEFACKCGCGFDTVDVELIEVLSLARIFFENPVYISSGCRCPAYNAKIGGSPQSMHMWGRAADITVSNNSPEAVQRFLFEVYHNKYGIGAYGTFTHLDTRSGKPARW